MERLSVEQDVVRLLLNKYQRHRGDTLNSRMNFLFIPFPFLYDVRS